MPEMGIASGAQGFNARHTVGRVGLGAHAVFRSRRPEARPAGPGVEFRAGLEERRLTASATIRPGLVAIVVLAGEGALGPLLTANMILLGRERVFPPLIVFVAGIHTRFL